MSKNELRSYPKVYNMGHRAIRDLFKGRVVVQEKVDGSQFSFGVVDGELFMRSKGRMLHAPVDDKLFSAACATVQSLFDGGMLVEGWTYRGEVLRGPKHNTLEYERAPMGNVILFDVDTGLEERVPDTDRLFDIGLGLGLEVVPVLFEGVAESIEQLQELLSTKPVLGGEMIEGVVVKNYDRWGPDGKMLMGKVVADAFRERHQGAWKKSNPGRKDIVEQLKAEFRNERRWEKAVEHLRDSGLLDESPKDIGPLIKEVQRDIEEECGDDIAQVLLKHFIRDILRGATAGLPEWYKSRLLETQFEEAA